MMTENYTHRSAKRGTQGQSIGEMIQMGEAEKPSMIESSRDARDLQSFLSGRDVPCPTCGYNLRDLHSDTCPECQAKVRISIGLADVRMGPWLASVLAIVLPLGVSLLFCAIWIIALVQDGGSAIGRNDWPFLISSFGFPAVCLPALFGLVAKRRRFWSHTRPWQVTVATLIVLASAGVFAGGIATIIHSNF